jgi:hypothetical protein
MLSLPLLPLAQPEFTAVIHVGPAPSLVHGELAPFLSPTLSSSPLVVLGMALARRARRQSGLAEPRPSPSGSPTRWPTARPASWPCSLARAPRPGVAPVFATRLAWPRHSWRGAQPAARVPVAGWPFVSACAARDRCVACPGASVCACPRRESLAVSTVVTAHSLWMSSSFVARHQPAAPLPLPMHAAASSPSCNLRKSSNPVPNRIVVAPRLSSCSCRGRTHIRVCTACRRGLDDVHLPVDRPPSTSSTPTPPCTCTRSRHSHVSLLPFTCAVSARRHRAFTLCRARDPHTLVNHFVIIIHT